MKKTKFIRAFFTVVVACGLIVFLSRCQRQIEPIVIGQFTISGQVLYPNYNGTNVAAAGALLTIYSGSSDTGKSLATTFANASGNYQFMGLLSGPYHIDVTYNAYNTNSNNTGSNINSSNGQPQTTGIYFAASSNLTVSANVTANNYTVGNVTTPGTLNIMSVNENQGSLTHNDSAIIKADTTGTKGALREVSLEPHSNCTFYFEFTDSQAMGMNMSGGFGCAGDNTGSPNGFAIRYFRFDQGNPANSYFTTYCLLSRITTGCGARDSFESENGGTLSCMAACFGHDSAVVGGRNRWLPQTDTLEYVSSPGSWEVYGSGYLVHGMLYPCHKYSGGQIVPPRTTPVATDNGLGYNGQYGWNCRIGLPVAMYIQYEGEKIVVKGANFTPYFQFQANMIFNRHSFYMNAGIGDNVTVNGQVQFTGVQNMHYPSIVEPQFVSNSTSRKAIATKFVKANVVPVSSTQVKAATK